MFLLYLIKVLILTKNNFIAPFNVKKNVLLSITVVL